MTGGPNPPPVAHRAVPLVLALVALGAGVWFALARASPAPLLIAAAFAWAALGTR